MMDDSDNLKFVGELRVPWVPEHRIDEVFELESAPRRTLALPIMYMQHLQCVYGFLGTYDETISLQQGVASQGVWRI
jgi:hypothetical protein